MDRDIARPQDEQKPQNMAHDRLNSPLSVAGPSKWQHDVALQITTAIGAFCGIWKHMLDAPLSIALVDYLRI